jgi:hypothetical protein
MHRISGSATVEVESPVIAQPISKPSPAPEFDQQTDARPARDRSRWLLVLMIVLCGTFAGGFAKFVLYPAIRAAAAPADHGILDGP